MNPRERILAALNHQQPDRIPCLEVWIDGMDDALRINEPLHAHGELGQDGVLLPWGAPEESNSWKNGIDEWGRVWKDGMYKNGVVDTPADLERYQTPAGYEDRFFNLGQVERIKAAYPDHCWFFGTHIGPFMNAYLSMGLAAFCMRIVSDPTFVHALMAARTEWCLAVFEKAIQLGSELIIMGDDSAHSTGPFISPAMWREFVLPYHKHIVQTLSVPVLWHSDGNITKLLPMAVEAGFAGIHGLEPWSVSLAKVKADYGANLVLIGNADVRVLCSQEIDPVQQEIKRCVREGGSRGYIFSSCNSIFAGMNPDAVNEFFRFQKVYIQGENPEIDLS